MTVDVAVMTPAQMAAEVLRLSEAATAGPWYVMQYEHDDPNWLYVGAIDAGDGCNVSFEPFPEDAEFIAYTRTAGPAIAQALVAALERERELVEALDVLQGDHVGTGWAIVTALEPIRNSFASPLQQAVHDAVRAIVTAATAREENDDAPR